jgi:hypothetical protein
MKCIRFYCNVAYKLKGKGLKTKRIWIGYKIKFVSHATWILTLSTWSVTLTAVMASRRGGIILLILEEDGPWLHTESPHFHRKVTHFLNRKFTEKWTGRGEPNTWPPRSPDLTPFDFGGGGG